MKSRSVYVGNHRFVSDNGRQAAIVLDLKPNEGGENMGPTPYELLGMALSGCTGTIFNEVALASKVTVDSLRVEIETFTPEDSRTFTKADVVVYVKANTTESKLKRIFKKTTEICPVILVYKNAGIQLDERLVIE